MVLCKLFVQILLFTIENLERIKIMCWSWNVKKKGLTNKALMVTNKKLLHL